MLHRLRHLKYCFDRAFAEYRETAQPEAELSFAQYAEDLIVDRLLSEVRAGFYVDVGAHHPVRYSNTYRLYRRGWRGINIDATPGSMAPFRRLRPRDVNLECGVGLEAGERVFHQFNHPGLNTFDAATAAQAEQDPRFRIVARTTVPVRPLSELLHPHLIDRQEWHLLTVDVEGLDEAVVRSIDWKGPKPLWILVESHGRTIDEIVGCGTHLFLTGQGYKLRLRGIKTSFYHAGDDAGYGELLKRI